MNLIVKCYRFFINDYVYLLPVIEKLLSVYTTIRK